MKTTIDIPDDLMRDALKFSDSRTKREVVVVALKEFNQRHRMARLAKAFGTCDQFISLEELEKSRRND